MGRIRNRFAALVACPLLLLASAASHAALITGVSAISSTGIGYVGTLVANTVNGVGLSSLDLSANHAPTLPGNSYVSLGLPVITFDLAAFTASPASVSGTRMPGAPTLRLD